MKIHSNTDACIRAPGWLLLGLALALSGCQLLTESPSAREERTMKSPDSDMLAVETPLEQELAQIDGLPATKQQEQYNALRSYLQIPACEIRSIRMVMLYSLLSSPPSEDLPLLIASMEQCLEAAPPPVPMGMARLLLGNLEQHQLAAERNRRLEAEVQRERARNASLSEQLDAIKAIERSLRDRGQQPTTQED